MAGETAKPWARSNARIYCLVLGKEVTREDQMRGISPIAAVGVKAKLAKRTSGCQNQKCENTAIPTIPDMFLCPALEISEMVMLRPPASSKPVAVSKGNGRRGARKQESHSAPNEW